MRLSGFLLCLLATVVGTTVATPTAVAAADGPTHVAGWALAGPTARIAGGQVNVRSPNGRDLVQPADRGARTSKTGTFSVRTRPLPSRYIVTVTGGRVKGVTVPGTLRALVSRANGRPLAHVTPLTTLVAARVRHHGSIIRAERELHRYLKIPASHDIYVDLRRDGRSFDGVRWLQQARRDGGVAPYSRRTARLLTGRPRPMRPRAGARAAQAGEEEGAEAAVEILPDSAAKNLLAGALREVGATAMGKVLSGIGFGDGAALAEISRQLVQLQKEVNELNMRVEQLSQQVTQLQAQVAQGNYSSLGSNLGVTWVGDGRNDSILTNLTWLVDHAAGCTATSLTACVDTLPPNTDAAAWCQQALQKTPVQSTACTTLSAIKTLREGDDAKDLQARLVGSDSTDGFLQSYQKAAYARIRATNGGDFIAPSYLAGAQTVQKHYAWISVLIAQYGMEYDTAIGLPDALVANPISTAIANLGDQAALLPEPLPARTVIHTRTGRVWKLLSNDAGACGTKAGWLAFWPKQLKTPDQAACQRWITQQAAAMGSAAVGNVPTTNDLKDLTKNRTGPSLHDWLRDDLGMPDLTGVSTAFPIPPPDLSLFGYSDRSLFFDNPGTNFGLGTSTCGRKAWRSSNTIYNDYNEFALGTWCDYIDLGSGSPRSQCIEAWNNQSAGYYPCSMPVFRRTAEGYGSISAPLDYGHPVVWMFWRPVAQEDAAYYRE